MTTTLLAWLCLQGCLQKKDDEQSQRLAALTDEKNKLAAQLAAQLQEVQRLQQQAVAERGAHAQAVAFAVARLQGLQAVEAAKRQKKDEQSQLLAALTDENNKLETRLQDMQQEQVVYKNTVKASMMEDDKKLQAANHALLANQALVARLQLQVEAEQKGRVEALARLQHVQQALATEKAEVAALQQRLQAAVEDVCKLDAFMARMVAGYTSLRSA